MVNNRLLSAEALRFIFMIIIALWHFGRINPFTHGYIAVDFFFILSGYFIYRSYIKHKYDAVEYTIAKLKRFFPEYIIVFVIAFFLKLQILLRDNNIVTVLFNAISEGTLIHSIGIFSGNVNPPSWYISVLLIGGGILYSMLFYNKKLSVGIIFPLFILFSYTYLLGFNGSIEQFATIGFVCQPLIRGMAGMALGVVLSVYSSKYREVLAQKHEYLDVFSLIAAVVVGVLLFENRNYDNMALLAFCMLVLSCSISNSLMNKIFKSQIWAKLGGVTFEMLLVHSPIIWVMNNLTRSIPLSSFEKSFLSVVYIIVVVTISFVLKLLNNRVLAKLK